MITAFTELTFRRINVHATLSSPNMVQVVVVVVVGWRRGLMEPLSEVFDMLQFFEKILPLRKAFDLLDKIIEAYFRKSLNKNDQDRVL